MSDSKGALGYISSLPKEDVGLSSGTGVINSDTVSSGGAISALPSDLVTSTDSGTSASDPTAPVISSKADPAPMPSPVMPPQPTPVPVEPAAPPSSAAVQAPPAVTLDQYLAVLTNTVLASIAAAAPNADRMSPVARRKLFLSRFCAVSPAARPAMRRALFDVMEELRVDPEADA